MSSGNNNDNVEVISNNEDGTTDSYFISPAWQTVEEVAIEITESEFDTIRWNGYEKTIKRADDDGYEEDFEWLVKHLRDWVVLASFR